MFFGLFNAPTNFQKYVNKILAKKLDIFFIIVEEKKAKTANTSLTRSSYFPVASILAYFFCL